jgi:hypothetical protein
MTTKFKLATITFAAAAAIAPLAAQSPGKTAPGTSTTTAKDGGGWTALFDGRI